MLLLFMLERKTKKGSFGIFKKSIKSGKGLLDSKVGVIGTINSTTRTKMGLRTNEIQLREIIFVE